MGEQMRKKILTAIRLANNRYLQSELRCNASDRHEDISAQFEQHMATLSDFCMNGYSGAGYLTMAFVCELHKGLFAPDFTFRQEVDGKLYEVVPGKYREGQGAVDSTLQPGEAVVFAPPEDVSVAMEGAVAKLNAVLVAADSAKVKRDAVMWFIFDFSVIHPFGDANGRLMCMLCDLLLIKEGLLPFHIGVIKDQHREDLYRAGEQAQRSRDLSPLYAVIERYNPAALEDVAEPAPNDAHKPLHEENDALQQLEALRHHPSFQVPPEQRPAIVEQILHHLMRPYFENRTPEMQAKFGEAQYQAFMQFMAEYCLRGYVDNPEPHLTIEFIKGLHRQFYNNAASVPIKAVDGTMITMVPGEFKNVPVFVKREGEWRSTPLENVKLGIERLLDSLHNEGAPLFQRYIQFMFDLQIMHPFPDSNGKMGLLLGDLFLLKHEVHPPFISKYWWSSKDVLDTQVARCAESKQCDFSGFYAVVLKLYSENDFGLGCEWNLTSAKTKNGNEQDI